MATTANPPSAAVNANGSTDPFTSSPSQAHPAPLRYAAFDNDHFSLYATNSPSAARRALEAHLKDTDRRIQDASRLGTTLIHQRKELSARLKEAEQLQQDSEVPAELRQKLADLEHEYNEIGRESARAFLPRSRVASDNPQEPSASSSVITGSGRQSPTKTSAPSRRQRNQQNARVHDIEFATEISTSLLAQVRQLQTALAEKDDELKDTTAAKAQLDAEAANMVQRIRHMDENEHKYKDENWNLETRLQELEAAFKQSTDKENRLTQTLKSTQSEMAAKERELDDLKVTHENLNEDHAMAKKVQEADLHGLRRDVAIFETDKQRLQKKVEELTAQNTELARAVSYRFSQQVQPSDTDFVSAEEGVNSDDQSPIQSEPASPVKGTPARHGMLESETLKSSLNHAHRMIQNLKNTIHREKTEKIELKRMLQDARDELETRRDGSNIAANVAKKRRNEPEGIKFKRPTNNGRLGAARSSTTEVVDEPDWEDDAEQTPSKARQIPMGSAGATIGFISGETADHTYGRADDDSTDAFETANEQDTTESEAFATGNEDFDNDTEGDVTETEGSAFRSVSARRSYNISSSKPGDRLSYMSTASTSGDDDDNDNSVIRTPVQPAQQPKYKLRLARGARRTGRVGDILSDSPSLGSNYSPASSTGTPQATNMQSLGDELDALDDDSLEGTPASSRMIDFEGTPETQRQLSAEPDTPTGTEPHTVGIEQGVAHAPDVSSTLPSFPSSPPVAADEVSSAMSPSASMFALTKPEMVDSGVMTEPWEPERIVEERIVEKIVEVPAEPTERHTLAERAGDLVGGALAGFGLSRIVGKEDADSEKAAPDAPENVQGEEMKLASTEPSMTSTGTDARPATRTASIGTDAFDEPRQADAVSVLPLQAFPRPADSTTKQDVPAAIDSAPSPIFLSFSEVVTQDFEPHVPPSLEEPLLMQQSSKGQEQPYTETALEDGSLEPTVEGRHTIPGTDGAKVGAGFFAGAAAAAAAAPTLLRKRSRSMPTGERSVRFAEIPVAAPRDMIESRVFSGQEADEIRNAIFGNSASQQPSTSRAALADISPNVVQSKSMADEGSQTIVSGDEIDGALRNKSALKSAPLIKGAAASGVATAAAIAAASTPTKPDSRLEARPSAYESPSLRGSRRPSSAGSTRSKGLVGAPPLPPDHTQKIAAATQQAPETIAGPSTFGAMGPPTMPASAYRPKSRTHHERPGYERTMSRDGSTPRAMRNSDNRGQLPSDKISRRTSFSSFASELDERFNIGRGQIMYPQDVAPATDPRLIQAITQTMIGEYLWKYTRKAGRSETSTTRHRRFFWVHPYTRTLYWSEQDPSTAGRNMLKAKSVAIDAVRVMSDDNAYPPGLHRKSLVVVTPGREIVFTAPTGQRHETWFNALSYLLLRTEQEKSEAEDTIDEEDVNEFNPGFGRTVRRSISRITGTNQARSQSRQSRASLSSYNSRTTRTTSPHRPDEPTFSQPHDTGTVRQRGARTSTGQNTGLNATVTKDSRASGSMAGRFSSITSRFLPVGSQRARSSARSSTSVQDPEDPAQIYDASIVADSAEDLRAVIEQQEREADRLENVRACCDGKHDVGSLSKRHKHSSFGSRFSSHGGDHSHSHAHRAR